MGFGPVRPPGPPPGPADPGRAVAVGLLNLSGLGIGYVLVRRRLLALLCVAATAALLTVALPARPDGVPGWALAGYGVLLLAAAADGARRGLRAPSTSVRIRPAVAIALGVVLLAVPAGGAVAYDGLRDDAVEEMLLQRLDRTDALVAQARQRGFEDGDSTFVRALGRYDDLVEEHPGSQAARRVPASLTKYYEAVAAPYGTRGGSCASVDGLTYLRTVPRVIDRDVLGKLATWPDDRLAESLLACGATRLGSGGSDRRGGELGELLRTFPDSEQARKVGPTVLSALGKRDDMLGDGGRSCRARDEVRGIGRTVDGLPAATADALRGEVRRALGKGLYACGLEEFDDKSFAAARRTLTEFTDAYKSDSHRARARQIAIAAEIAEKRPQAGDRLPPRSAPGGTGMEMVISNDGPDPVEVLYTGPVTGRITIGACGSCTTYPTEAAGRGKACQASGKSYPKKTLRLPPGTYHFLHKPGGKSATASGRAAGGRVQPGYSYTQCSYVVRSQLGADL
ncbi:hypothetical protein [Streptomyces sp. WG-D5]